MADLQARVARHTARLDEVVAFYRDGLGGFRDHDGWAQHGLTFADPDGFRVVLVPERWAP